MAVIRDPEVCESCTQYTDPAKLITINTGDYHADIYFDRLEDMPTSNIRKVFKLLLADPWSNEGAIRQMTLYLDAAVIESKEAWKQASIEYQNGWRLVANKKSRLKEDPPKAPGKQPADRCRKADQSPARALGETSNLLG